MAERIIKLFCVFALAIQALIPAGYMLAPSSNGEISIVICTASGPRTIVLDADGAQVPANHQNDQDDGKLCDFATVGAIALLSDAPFRIATDARFEPVVHRIQLDRFTAPRKLGAISARGPPAGSGVVA